MSVPRFEFTLELELDPEKEVAQQCYQRARAFLKRGVKADNKVYDEEANADKAHEALLRIETAGVLSGYDEPSLGPARRAFDCYTVGYGQVMRETGNTYGNCGESAGLAASYAAEIMPKVRLTVVTADTADHALLVVGWMPDHKVTIDQLETAVPASSASYAVDVWAGICCHTRLYPARLKEKMLQWEQKGKRVVVVNKELPTRVLPTDWAREVGASGIMQLDPNKFGSAEDLQRLHHHMKVTRDDAMWNLEQQTLANRETRQNMKAGLREIGENPAGFLEGELVEIQRRLNDPGSTPDEQDALKQRLHLMEHDQNGYLQRAAQELTRVLREALDERLIIERKRQHLGSQLVRRERPPLAPLATSSLQSRNAWGQDVLLPLADQPKQLDPAQHVSPAPTAPAQSTLAQPADAQLNSVPPGTQQRHPRNSAVQAQSSDTKSKPRGFARH